MTERLYDKDAYLQEFVAGVISCEPDGKGYQVILDKTAFYPEGGGQPGDMGTLEAESLVTAVLDVQQKNGDILHLCAEAVPPGTKVKGRIDWKRRITHMREHSGEHILSGILCERYGLHNIGFHMGKEYVTIDFDGLLTWEQLDIAQELANAKVLENVEIEAGYPTEEVLDILAYRSKKEISGPVRIVKIPGADVCACCGTHVRRTGEVGPIRIIAHEHYKNGIRLTVLIGEKALADYAQKTVQIKKISTILSAKPEQAAEAVERLQENYNRMKTEYTGMKLAALERKVEEIPDGCKNAVIFEKGLSSAQLRRLADRLKSKAAFAGVFTQGEGDGYQYVLCSDSIDVLSVGKEMNVALQGKGGGKNPMFQGFLQASGQDVEAFLLKKGLMGGEN